MKMAVDGDEQETFEDDESESSEDEGAPEEELSVDSDDNEKAVDPKIQQLELQVSRVTGSLCVHAGIVTCFQTVHGHKDGFINL